VPFSNNAPLAGAQGHERTGVLLRAASYEAPPDEVLSRIENLLGLGGTDALRYADKKKGQRRAMRLVRTAGPLQGAQAPSGGSAVHEVTSVGASARIGAEARLEGFVLAGDTSAEAWIKTLLQDELPAQAYGRLLLVPGAKAPVAIQSRGKQVCTCFNVTDTAIDEHLSVISQGGGGAGYLGTDDERLASLQEALRCGTNCGSCLPELKRRVRSAHSASTAGMAAPLRTVIPIKQLA
ncbi:MAG: (2Fe-2S)-binding protein, partial [Polaromonas sp.]